MAHQAFRGFALVAGLALGLTSLSACDMLNWGSQFAPTPSPASQRPSPSPTPSAAPSETVTAPAGVKATGSLKFYANTVSDALVGTCSSGQPFTVTLSDHANDFYTTVDAQVVLDLAQLQVTSISINTGEDGEGGLHKMSYAAAAPVAGTSARLIGSGPDYQLTGTLQDQDSPHGKPVTTLVPFTLKVVCQAK